MRKLLLVMLGSLISGSAFGAVTVPYTEDFASNAANWYNSGGSAPLNWVASGGPDGGAHVSGTFNFVGTAVGGSGVVFRGQSNFNASGNAFVGDWIGGGVTDFSAYVYHEAGEPLTFFTRFATVAGFPGAFAEITTQVPSGTWTQISVPINAANPQFVSFEGGDFNSIFSSLGRVQIGADASATIAGVDRVIPFALDKVMIVPEPATASLFVLAGFALVRRHVRATTETGNA